MAWEGEEFDFLMIGAIQNEMVGHRFLCINMFSFHSLPDSSVLRSLRRFWGLGSGGPPGGWRMACEECWEESWETNQPSSSLWTTRNVLAFWWPAVVPLLVKGWGCGETGELLANFPFTCGLLPPGDQDTVRNRHSATRVIRRNTVNQILDSLAVSFLVTVYLKYNAQFNDLKYPKWSRC